MDTRGLLVGLIFLVSLGAQGEGQKPVKVTKPPENLKLAAFYEKYVDADGLPILSSAKVPDEALLAARVIVLQMGSKKPDVFKEMARRKTRVAVMARTEVTTDIPEHADLYLAFPGTDWNKRCRGVGATVARPVSSCAEENLLGYADDPYRGESILIHEFAHSMLRMGILFLDDAFMGELEAAYQEAIKRKLWEKTYAATTSDEYWAEGVQSWFDANLEANPADGIHNEINTREELKKHDPKLARLIARYFPEDAWKWSPPKGSKPKK